MSRSRWLLAATALSMAVTVGFAPPASAGSSPCGATQKCFAAVLSPSTAVTGSTKSYTLTLTNESPASTTIQLGSADLTPPSGFTLVGTNQPTPQGDATIAGNVLLLRNLAILPGGSGSVSFSATAPSSAGSYAWTIEGHQSNNFNPSTSSNTLSLDTANSNLGTSVQTMTQVSNYVDGTVGGDVQNGTPEVDPATNQTPGVTDVIIQEHYNPQAGAGAGLQTLSRLDPASAGNFCGTGPCTFVWDLHDFLTGYTSTSNPIILTFVCDVSLCQAEGTAITLWERGSNGTGIKLPLCGFGVHPCVASVKVLSGGANDGDTEIVSQWLSGDPVPGVCVKICV